jgi:hypothetical protein
MVVEYGLFASEEMKTHPSQVNIAIFVPPECFLKHETENDSIIESSPPGNENPSFFIFFPYSFLGEYIPGRLAGHAFCWCQFVFFQYNICNSVLNHLIYEQT